MGLAVPQRDALHRVQHWQGSACWDGGNPKEKAPQISFFFPPFIHYTGALWQFRLSWRSRMQ